MITIHVNGWLWNQMFQYAAGFALSKKLEVPLLVDTSAYATYRLRNFELRDVFLIHGRVTKFPLLSLVKNKLVVGKKKAQKIYKEPHFNVDDKFFNIQDGQTIQGYFQSERYFKEFSREIKEEFAFKQELDKDNRDIQEKISTIESVSIHIRRGDYVNHSLHHNCPLSYYQEAIKQITDKVTNPKFFVFSDDIERCKQNLGVDAEYVHWNGWKDARKDMCLMSNCKHNIIANSSFSRRGARLNANPQKIVFAPKKRFNDDTNTSDIIPDSWTKI